MNRMCMITWCVICCWNIIIDNCVIWSLITSYVICCAKCHFHPFQFLSSISQPPSWKMLPVAKTPKNSTLQAIFIKNRIESYFILLFHTISHFVVITTKNRCPKNGTHTRVLCNTRFLVNTIYIF